VAALRADGNEKEALHWLGWSYETANGCDDDAKQAAACYLRAAKLGHVEAM
jgi:TPR repeat protein